MPKIDDLYREYGEAIVRYKIVQDKIPQLEAEIQEELKKMALEPPKGP